MKLFNKIFLGAFALTSLSVLPACQEEESTIDGADAVYIELTPKNIEMCAGDTVRLSARISNVANDDIYSEIKWSVDDPSVAEIRQIDVYRWVADPDYEEPDGSGEDTDVPGEGETTTPSTPSEPDDPHKGQIKQFVESYLGIIAKNDAQGKNTIVRAILPNNKYGIAPVSVGYRSIGEETIVPEKDYMRCYHRDSEVTCWFKVSPYSVLNDCHVSYEFVTNEVLNMTSDPEEDHFRFSGETEADNVVYDPQNSRIGIKFTAPRGCGRGELTVTLSTDEGGEATASCPLVISPAIDPGLNATGDPSKRPMAGPNNPSNVKICLTNQTMDINSTLRIEACVYVPNNGQLDIENAFSGEKGEDPMMKWVVDGSVVLVEGQGIDQPDDYQTGGYVSYLDLKSGIRTGNATIQYITPDTLMTVNLVVDDYNNSYPINRVWVGNVWLDDEGTEQYTEINQLTTYIDDNPQVAIITDPEESYEYHIPTVTIQNPSILSLYNKPGTEGYVVRLHPLALGTTTLHIESLDKTLDFPVTVIDRISSIRFPIGQTSSVFVNGTLDLTTNVTMASGAPNATPVEFTSSDESVATVTLKPGTLNVAQVTGVSAGTATITAKAGDQTATYTVSVQAAENIVVDDNYGNCMIWEGGILIEGADGRKDIEIYEDGVPGADIIGHYSGIFTVPVTYDSKDYDDCAYDFTITAEGDGFRVVGYIQLDADIKIEINALFYE